MAFRLTGTAQEDVVERIGKPSSCEIVVGMLWSKLGQPINHRDYLKEGGGYFAGTEWELEEAAQAWEDSGQKLPNIYLFKCKRGSGFGIVHARVRLRYCGIHEGAGGDVAGDASGHVGLLGSCAWPANQVSTSPGGPPCHVTGQWRAGHLLPG